MANYLQTTVTFKVEFFDNIRWSKRKVTIHVYKPDSCLVMELILYLFDSVTTLE